jgi:Flp pilus assembly pilin Flp
MGQTTVEYALLLALITIVVLVALMFLGPVIVGLLEAIGINLQGRP